MSPGEADVGQPLRTDSSLTPPPVSHADGVLAAKLQRVRQGSRISEWPQTAIRVGCSSGGRGGGKFLGHRDNSLESATRTPPASEFGGIRGRQQVLERGPSRAEAICQDVAAGRRVRQVAELGKVLAREATGVHARAALYKANLAMIAAIPSRLAELLQVFKHAAVTRDHLSQKLALEAHLLAGEGNADGALKHCAHHLVNDLNGPDYQG